MPTTSFDYSSMQAVTTNDYQGARPEHSGDKLWLLRPEMLTTKEQIVAFTQDPALCNMVYATAYLLKEKRHEIGCFKPSLTFYTDAKNWFITNTSLDGEKFTDKMLRLIVAYSMQAKFWLPPPLTLTNFTGPELPLPFLITSIWFALDATNGEFLNDSGEEVPGLTLLPDPLFPGDPKSILNLSGLPGAAHLATIPANAEHAIPVETATTHMVVNQEKILYFVQKYRNILYFVQKYRKYRKIQELNVQPCRNTGNEIQE